MTEDDEMLCIHEITVFVRHIYSNYPNFPESVFYKSLLLLHKFFRKVAIRQLKHDKCLVGVACFFLATKLEDCPAKLTDLAMLYHKVVLMRNDLPMKVATDTQRSQVQAKISELEGELLRQIGFDLEIELPSLYFKQFASYPSPDMDKILKVATRVCCDTFLKPMCIYYHPLQIACACIYFATLSLKITLPDNEGKPWYKYLHEGIELKYLQDITEITRGIQKKLEEKKKSIPSKTTPQSTTVSPPKV